MKPYITIACLALAACQTTKAVVIAPVGCPPSLTQLVLPQPLLPDGAYPPRPVTQPDAEALDAFLAHVASVAAWGRANQARATTAKTFCEGLK
jgi:hypothetical protein